MFEHADVLSDLAMSLPLEKKLAVVQGLLNKHFSSIDRIAVALYDPKTDALKTFVSSDDTPLVRYEVQLVGVPSLGKIMATRRPRVLDDLTVFAESGREHSQRILAQGFRSSYTLPMFAGGDFIGFIFFDSRRKAAFSAPVLYQFDVVGHLISMMIINEIGQIRTLLAAVRSAQSMAHRRDPETGSHLDRVSGYAQLIARHVAARYRLDDDAIEHIFLFAPLHDVGKIGIPDRILLKPADLDADEWAVMRTHAAKGLEIIDDMIAEFGLTGLEHLNVLRNIAHFHHETLDGKGYPVGLKGEAIPIEARIVSVADIFDALTSQRPYKRAWNNEEALHELSALAAEGKLDGECVAALLENRSAVSDIQQRFREQVFA
ncbi:MAG: HD domain-containing protein [Betaproteobacteria bacterium]|nr:HD domain-containing protein [Betaproteobacteria bacterium]